MLYIYTKDYYSTIKNKEWNYGIHRNINGPRDSHTMWSQSERQISWYCLLCGSSEKDRN